MKDVQKASFSSIAEDDKEDEESGEEEKDKEKPQNGKDVNDFFVDGHNLAFDESQPNNTFFRGIPTLINIRNRSSGGA